jgi:hypothetical protein
VYARLDNGFTNALEAANSRKGNNAVIELLLFEMFAGPVIFPTDRWKPQAITIWLDQRRIIMKSIHFWLILATEESSEDSTDSEDNESDSENDRTQKLMGRGIHLMGYSTMKTHF